MTTSRSESRANSAITAPCAALGAEARRSVVTIGIRSSRNSARTWAPPCRRKSQLVLHGQHVDLIDVQEIGGAPIRLEVTVCNLEADADG